MTSNSVILFNSSFIGSSAGGAVLWTPGGRTQLVVNGQVYGANALQLQVQGPSNAWINVGSTIAQDQAFVFDAPAGPYRIVCQTSSAIGINAVLVSVPY